MDTKQAQAKIAEAIKTDAELVIKKAIGFNPTIEEIVEATRKAPGPIAGVAAIALKYALRGKSNEETVLNMIKFAESI